MPGKQRKDPDKLTETEKQEIEKAFNTVLPAGAIGLNQRNARMALFQLKLHPTILEVSKCCVDMGKEDEDVLSLPEFELLRCKLHEDTEAVMRWAFNKFDLNNDGTLDKDELKKILLTVYDDVDGELVDDDFVNDCLMMADTNQDGVLQIEEFVDMIMERTGANKSTGSADG